MRLQLAWEVDDDANLWSDLLTTAFGRIDHCNPILKARYFGVLFDRVPSYAEIDCGTLQNEKIPEVNELFKLALSGTSSLVRFYAHARTHFMTK
ncbi:MAG: hypothetical protein WAQ24_02100 [Candidatus Saccharimonadales bacterium]